MSDQPTPSIYGEEPTPAEQPKAPGLLDQIIGVFTEPVALFQKLRNSPSFWPSLILAISIGIVASLIWAAKAGTTLSRKGSTTAARYCGRSRGLSVWHWRQ